VAEGAERLESELDISNFLTTLRDCNTLLKNLLSPKQKDLTKFSSSKVLNCKRNDHFKVDGNHEEYQEDL
jgi:hypothetical protein